MGKKIVHYIFYFLIITTVFFSVIEFSTRIVSWLTGKGLKLSLHELEAYDKEVENIYEWHPFAGYTFKSNYAFTGSHPNQAEQALLYLDKNGFLVNNGETHIDYKKADNEIRIAFIGGSTTASVNLSFDENWPGYLGRLIQKHFPKRRIQIINAAVPGFDTAENIGNLALRVMPFDPDIVIIYQAYNDLVAIRTDKFFKPDYSHIHERPFAFYQRPNIFIRYVNKSMFYVRLRNIWREHKMKMKDYSAMVKVRESLKGRISYIPDEAARTFEQHMRILISIARAGGSKVILSSYATLHNPKLDWSDDETFKYLTGLQRRELASFLHFTPGLTIDGIFKGLDQYNSLLKEIAEQEEAGWVDNALLVPHEDRYFVDRIHFSKLGARRMAENFLPAVLKILENR